jgi:hypothetical protein
MLVNVEYSERVNADYGVWESPVLGMKLCSEFAFICPDIRATDDVVLLSCDVVWTRR